MIRSLFLLCWLPFTYGNAQVGPEEAATLIALADTLITEDLDSAAHYLERARPHSRSSPELRYTFLITEAHYLSTRGYNTKALEMVTEAVAVTRELGNDEHVRALAFRGRLQQTLGDYEAAILTFFTVDSLNRQTANEVARADNLVSLGISYRLSGVPARALDYYRGALAINRALPRPMKAIRNQLNIIDAYLLLGENERAKRQADTVTREAAALGDDLTTALTSFYLARIDRQDGDLTAAARGFTAARVAFDRIGVTTWSATSRHKLAATESQLGDHPLALQQLDEALTLARSIDKPDLVRDIYRVYTDVYSAADDYRAAFTSQGIHDSLDQMLQNQAGAARVRDLQFAFEDERRGREVANMQAAAALDRLRLRNQQLIILAVLLGALAFGSFAVLYYLRTRVLAQKNARIERQNREKDLLITEIDHRARNHLAIIESLLREQSSKLQDARARQPLIDSQTRVHAITLLNRLLHQAGDTDIRLDAYLDQLTGYVETAYFSDRPIRLLTELDEVTVHLMRAIPIGLLVTEAAINTSKHAFPDEASGGQLTVRLQRTAPDRVRLIIRDNGTGLGPRQQPTDLTLINGLGRQIGDELVVDGQNGLRVEVSIRL